jgi:transposase
MNVKKNSIVGIDVSYKTFNAHCGGRDVKYQNSPKGWRMLLGDFPGGSVFAMEATGNYHYRLASFLKSKGLEVLVLNPYWTKCYMRSLGVKAKSDGVDPMYIAQYAGTSQARRQVFEPLHPKLERAKRIVTLLSQLAKMERSADNVRHAFSLVARSGDALFAPLGNVAEVCREEQESLLRELYGIVGVFYHREFMLLRSIKGMGKKTAAIFLVECNGFAGFATCKQLSSWVGVAPGTDDSGTSVKGSGRIRKAGCRYLRKMLYGCVASAVRFFKPCAELYAKLRRKGRTHKKAGIAVMHKLVKIAFGVVKSGEPCKALRPV